MQFSSLLLFASTALAGSIEFVSQDSTDRTIYFSTNPGLETIEPLVVTGLSTTNQTFPTGWIGNFYSVSDGNDNVPGMLGEVTFDGWAGSTYFDVSAIVNPSDLVGVQQIFPLHSNAPIAGCDTFPCEKAYYAWDDVATFSSEVDALVCTLGVLSSTRRRGLVARMTRDFVTGEKL
jgi:hypothetical protein